MFMSFIIFMYALYILFGVFFHLPVDETGFYLMLDKKKNKRSITLIFYICLFLYQYKTYKKSQKSIVNEFSP